MNRKLLFTVVVAGAALWGCGSCGTDGPALPNNGADGGVTDPDSGGGR